MKQRASVRHLAISGFASAVLVIVAPASTAADKPGDKPREGSLGKGKSSAAILTRSELRACLTQQAKLKTETADIVAQQRTLDDDKADIMRRQSAVDEERAALDRTSQAAVDAFSARARELDPRIDAYNTRNATFNARADALRAQQQSWERDCGDRRYYENDLIIIKAGR